jgi:hypothetical protein
MPCPDDNHLAELLGEVYEDKQKLDEVANACYERVTDSCFEWETVAQDFDDVFKDVLAQGNKPEIKEAKSKRKKKAKEKQPDLVGAGA